jgi:hypothetical protein
VAGAHLGERGDAVRAAVPVQVDADDAADPAADADVRPVRPGAGQQLEVGGAPAMPARRGCLASGGQREHGQATADHGGRVLVTRHASQTQQPQVPLLSPHSEQAHGSQHWHP